jgi:serine/threonine protein phosphatase PrpC
MSVSRLSVRRHTVAKAGNRDDENEDAVEVDEQRLVVALADGSTEGAYSRDWAQWLAARFVTSENRYPEVIQSAELLSGAIHEALETWHANFSEHIAQRRDDLPWYVERARAQGGFATLLVLAATAQQNDVTWHAAAVGDSCLFHVDQEANIACQLPSLAFADFDLSPRLLSSAGIGNSDTIASTTFANGRLTPSDRLVLATDALSAWLVKDSVVGFKLRFAQLLDAARSFESFSAFVEAERLGGELRNDDVTFVLVEVNADRVT